MTPPPPESIPGTVAGRAGDTARLVGWARAGFTLGARHGTRLSRCYYAALSLAWWPWWPCWPLLYVVQLVRLTTGPSRYYLTPERDAVIAVTPRAGRHGGSWHLEDHLLARPGTGRGAVLRRLVLPVLADAADRAGVTIETTAVTEALALAYRVDLAGLIDIGPASIRGRRLSRAPG